jgi:hypothetical protein
MPNSNLLPDRIEHSRTLCAAIEKLQSGRLAKAFLLFSCHQLHELVHRHTGADDSSCNRPRLGCYHAQQVRYFLRADADSLLSQNRYPHRRNKANGPLESRCRASTSANDVHTSFSTAF